MGIAAFQYIENSKRISEVTDVDSGSDFKGIVGLRYFLSDSTDEDKWVLQCDFLVWKGRKDQPYSEIADKHVVTIQFNEISSTYVGTLFGGSPIFTLDGLQIEDVSKNGWEGIRYWVREVDGSFALYCDSIQLVGVRSWNEYRWGVSQRIDK